MDCVELEGNVSELTLLTHSDKFKKLASIFAKNKHSTDIFLPDSSFYTESVTIDDPERMADILFRWLGIKHRSLEFHVNPDQAELISYRHTKNSSQVILSIHCLEDSLTCGAAVAHAIVHHLLHARAKISLGDSEENESLADLGTIQIGFGVLILNSFETRPVLGVMAKHNYAREFIDYCSDQRIVSNVWGPYVLPGVSEKELETVPNKKILNPFVSSRFKRSRSRKVKMVSIIALCSLATFAAIFAEVRRPRPLSNELRELRDTVAVLKAEVDRCEETVRRKQNTWDQNDIFIQRQIDADKTRCASLSSRYNYELGVYNSKL